MKGFTKNKKFHPIRKSRSTGKTRRRINVGDNPEQVANLNKFIDKGGEGLRGTLVARTKDGKRGIILAQNSAFAKGGASWGKLYEVVEKNKNEYPVVKKQVKNIPDTKDWEILSTRKKRDEQLQPFVKKDIIENLADLDLMLRGLRTERRERELGGDKATGELTSQIRLIGGARLSILALLDQVPEPLHREISEGAHEIIMEMKE